MEKWPLRPFLQPKIQKRCKIPLKDFATAKTASISAVTLRKVSGTVELPLPSGSLFGG